MLVQDEGTCILTFAFYKDSWGGGGVKRHAHKSLCMQCSQKGLDFRAPAPGPAEPANRKQGFCPHCPQAPCFKPCCHGTDIAVTLCSYINKD